MKGMYVLLLLGSSLCAGENPLLGNAFYTTTTGVWTAGLSGGAPQRIASYSTEAATLCSDKAAGLDVDIIAGWVVLSCYSAIFHSRFDPMNLTVTPEMEKVELKVPRLTVERFHGVAIDTTLQMAYVASFESIAWVVRGFSIESCNGLSDTDCDASAYCYTSGGGCIRNGGYKLFQVLSSDPVAGGLYADEKNDIWLSHFDDFSVGTVTNQRGEIVPHVGTYFTAASYGVMELGYPVIAAGHLYIIAMRDNSSALLDFPMDGSTSHAVLFDLLPLQHGNHVGSGSRVHQPSFGVTTVTVNGNTLLDRLVFVHNQDDEGSVVSTVCKNSVCNTQMASLDKVPGGAMGVLSFRSPSRAVATAVPTAVPPTSAPPTTSPTTLLPNTPPPTPAPETDLPTMVPAPPCTPLPTPLPTVSTADSSSSSCDEGFSMVQLAIGIVSGVLAGVCLGFIGGRVTQGKKRKTINTGDDHASLEELLDQGPEHEEMIAQIIGSDAPSTPELPVLSNTHTSNVFAPIGEKQHSDLIQDCDFSEGHKWRDRVVSGEIIAPALSVGGHTPPTTHNLHQTYSHGGQLHIETATSPRAGNRKRGLALGLSSSAQRNTPSLGVSNDSIRATTPRGAQRSSPFGGRVSPGGHVARSVTPGAGRTSPTPRFGNVSGHRRKGMTLVGDDRLMA